MTKYGKIYVGSVIVIYFSVTIGCLIKLLTSINYSIFLLVPCVFLIWMIIDAIKFLKEFFNYTVEKIWISGDEITFEVISKKIYRYKTEDIKIVKSAYFRNDYYSFTFYTGEELCTDKRLIDLKVMVEDVDYSPCADLDFFNNLIKNVKKSHPQKI